MAVGIVRDVRAQILAVAPEPELSAAGALFREIGAEEAALIDSARAIERTLRRFVPERDRTAFRNQIALDLTEAMADLPETVPGAEAGRVTKWAAQALLARVYLFYNGVYNKELQAGTTAVNRTVVVGYLDNLIATSGHDLLEDYAENFKLSGENGIESVFEIAYGDTPPWWDWGYVRGGEGNL